MTDLEIWGYERPAAVQPARPPRCERPGCGHLEGVHGGHGCAVILCDCHAAVVGGVERIANFKSTHNAGIPDGGEPNGGAAFASPTRFKCSPREDLKITPSGLPPALDAIAGTVAAIGTFRAPLDEGAEAARENRRDARRRILGSAPNLRERIRRAVLAAGAEGLTAEEVEERTGLAGNTVRPRLGELLALGELRRTANLRRTRSRRLAVVWIASSWAAPGIAGAP